MRRTLYVIIMCGIALCAAAISGCGDKTEKNKSRITVPESTFATLTATVTEKIQETSGLETITESESAVTETTTETIVATTTVSAPVTEQQTSKAAVAETEKETQSITYDSLCEISAGNVQKYRAYSEKILENVNRIRNQENLGELRLDEELSKAAMLRALEMDYAGVFSHTRPNGNKGFTILKEFNIKYKAAAENIACGYYTADEVVKAWENSATHYKNMTNPKFTRLGVGYSRIGEKGYWVELFAD